MMYRQRLYESYVSGNKQFLRDVTPNPQKQDIRNTLNLRRALAIWIKKVPRNSKILGVACRSGNILSLLQEEGFTNLHGVDISFEQVQLARQKFPQVICTDAIEYLLQHPNEFLLITAFDILEHFNKEESIRFLDAIFSALMPGGRLILQVPNGDSPFAGGTIYGDLTHEVTYTTISLKHILLTCGFSNVQFQEHGPQPTSIKGFIRYTIWRILRQILRFIHFVETGGQSTGIYTPVMQGTAIRGS